MHYDFLLCDLGAFSEKRVFFLVFDINWWHESQPYKISPPLRCHPHDRKQQARKSHNQLPYARLVPQHNTALSREHRHADESWRQHCGPLNLPIHIRNPVGMPRRPK